MQRAGATKASMLQDLGRGIKTEVDVINGGVVELVHPMERGERRPGRDTFGELRELA